jgi:hypothetical protein
MDRETFQSLPRAAQCRLLGTRDMVLGKLKADGIPLDAPELCRKHLAAHTIAPKCCLDVFEAHLTGVFDSAIAD